jgi:hypothetical protein
MSLPYLEIQAKKRQEKKNRRRKITCAFNNKILLQCTAFDKNYVTNFKKNAGNQSFTPLSSIRHQLAAS